MRLDVGLVAGALVAGPLVALAMPVRLDVRLIVGLLAVVGVLGVPMPHAMRLDVGLRLLITVMAMALEILGHGLLLLVRSAKPVHMTATGTEIFPQV
jgi:hypothetical protein